MEDAEPSNVVLLAENRVIPVGKKFWKQFSTLRDVITDLEVEDDSEPIPLPNVHFKSLTWIQHFCEVVDPIPDNWTDKDIEEASQGEMPSVLMTEFRKLSVDHDIVPLLQDLNFLGGGYIYSHLCWFVSILIKEFGWNADTIRVKFGLLFPKD
jgi:hypothetical protein